MLHELVKLPWIYYRLLIPIYREVLRRNKWFLYIKKSKSRINMKNKKKKVGKTFIQSFLTREVFLK